MLKIANLEIKYNVMPSPMASFTDIVFRRLMDEIGYTGFMVTELISAEALRRRQARTLDMVREFDAKTPQFIQLFGALPDQFTEAAKIIENETTFKGIDINMGCPAPKIIKRDAGSALLKDPPRAAAVVEALKKTIRLPVTVKIRLGYHEVNVLEMAEALQNAGADALTVHFRLKTDGYMGTAKWEYAPLIKERLHIPFFGNGDILTVETARERLKTVDGIMIGRGAIKDPLLFARIAGADLWGRGIDHHWCITRLLDLIEEYSPPKFCLPRLKGFARFLFSGFSGSKHIRHRLYRTQTYEEARQLVAELRNHGE